MRQLVTARLTGEPLAERHLSDLIALHLDSEVSRFLGGVRTAEQTRDYLTVNLQHWARHGFGLWVLRATDGTFVGRAGLRHVMVDEVDEIEIAYAFARPFWGQGLAGETAAALTDLGLVRMALGSLIGIVDVDHVVSRRVLERAGYGLERRTTYHETEVLVLRRRA